MPGFVKPTRKVVNIEDAFGELIGKKLIKDLHDNGGDLPCLSWYRPPYRR